MWWWGEGGGNYPFSCYHVKLPSTINSTLTFPLNQNCLVQINNNYICSFTWKISCLFFLRKKNAILKYHLYFPFCFKKIVKVHTERPRNKLTKKQTHKTAPILDQSPSQTKINLPQLIYTFFALFIKTKMSFYC